MATPHDVIDFWFNELQAQDWFQGGDKLDAEIKARFSQLHAKAIVGELFEWRVTASGRLAEIIVLDQFSRNIYRNQPQAFASDPLALVLAQEAVAQGAAQHLMSEQTPFLYMPFMHSESTLIHQQAVTLYQQLGNANSLDFELRHKAIIDRFGRYPHRNAILGRQSTDDELAFLQQPGSSF